MPYNADHLVTLAELKQTAQAFKVETDKAIKYVAVSGNTISFFTSEDDSGTAAFTVDFPTELFLDQSRTQFVPNFTFTAASYPGAVNPSLDGKPVLVFAVKTTTDRTSGTVDDSYAYSFMDMSTLVDTYSPKAGDSAKILSISGYEIEVHISAAANNAITVQPDGLHVNISGKADKVASATANNLPALDANGNLTDSGILKTNVVQKTDIATTAEVTEMLSEVFGA